MLFRSFISSLLLCTTSCSDSDGNSGGGLDINFNCNVYEVDCEADEFSTDVTINSNREWGAYSTVSWLSCTPTSSTKEIDTIMLSVKANEKRASRSGYLIFMCGSHRDTIIVNQKGVSVTDIDPSITVPEGYELVWQDEFKSGNRPDTEKWYYETGDGGWGNNELQNYVAGSVDGEQLAVVSDGTFKIIAKKINNKVHSIRINTNESWQYGYFEARLKLPSGKGTWPAFWMMPKNYTSWPACGEIDIMEEVGYRPNYVSSAIHCNSYNHGIGTEKTAEKYLSTAQSEFHVYALEWTKDHIKTYVDGVLLMTFNNDKQGNKDTWPFDAPFYIKLNLA